MSKEVAVKTWLKRIRGAIGIGLTWAAAWFGAGMVLLFVVGFGAAAITHVVLMKVFPPPTPASDQLEKT